MSQLSLTVMLPCDIDPLDDAAVNEALATALAPFGPTEANIGKFDWYEVGFGFRGYFKTRPGAMGTVRVDDDGVFREAREGYCHVVRKSDVDWEGMAIDSLKGAERNWREAEGAIPPMRLFLHGIRRGEAYEQYVDRLKAGDFASVALIDLCGRWHECENVGWWTDVSDEKDRVQWSKEWSGAIGDAPDDTVLAAVCVHY